MPSKLRSKSVQFYNWAARFFGSFPQCAASFLSNLRAKRFFYVEISQQGLQASKRSDTIFIFGGGASIARIAPEQWEAIRNHDTMTFSYSIVQKFVPVKFHLIRELGLTGHDTSDRKEPWRKIFDSYADVAKSNPNYRNTVYAVQGGWFAYAGNRLIGGKFLPKGSRIFRFVNGYRYPDAPPSSSFERGLTHGPSTVTDCVNFAAILGYKTIVLCGIDLKDRRYFWNDPGIDAYAISGITDSGGGEYAGEGNLEEQHRTGDKMLRWAVLWKDELSSRGITLSIFNPDSKLAETLPLYSVVDG